MFNSVTKYLWGGAGNESDYTDQQLLQEGHHQSSEDGENRVVAVEEHGQEDDWVLVGNADKENSNLPVQHHYHHQLHHHHPHIHHHHHQSHHSSHDSLSQQSTEVELLDDAASLVRDILDPCGQRPLGDCDNKSLSDQEDNGMDSGVRPSSPESVFSACSGRSSATYRPRGLDSEAWVVAPPPCFTGSQCGSLSPLVSSPLENLLIEHPSMSVYVSQRASFNASGSDFSSQGLYSVHFSGSTTALPELVEAVNNVETVADTAALDDRLDGDVQRRRPVDPVHQRRTSLISALRAKDSAQRKAVSNVKKSISKQKCQRQNQVREMNSSSKSSINHKNKHLRPSGFKSSRTPQRFVPKMA